MPVQRRRRQAGGSRNITSFRAAIFTYLADCTGTAVEPHVQSAEPRDGASVCHRNLDLLQGVVRMCKQAIANTAIMS